MSKCEQYTVQVLMRSSTAVGQYTNSMTTSTFSSVDRDRPADYVLDFHSRYDKDVPTLLENGEMGPTTVQAVGHRCAEYTGQTMHNIAAIRILGANIPNGDVDLNIRLGRHVCSDDGGGQYQYFQSKYGAKDNSDKTERTLRFFTRHNREAFEYEKDSVTQKTLVSSVERAYNTLVDYGPSAPVFWSVDSSGKGRDVQALTIEWERHGRKIEEVELKTSGHTFELSALPRYLLKVPSGVFKGDVIVPDTSSSIFARVLNATTPQADLALKDTLHEVSLMALSTSHASNSKITFFDDDVALRIQVNATSLQGLGITASVSIAGTGGEIMLYLNQTDSQTANSSSRYHYAKVVRGGSGYPSSSFTLTVPYTAIDHAYSGSASDNVQLTVVPTTVSLSTANTAVKQRELATTPEIFNDTEWILRVRGPFDAVLEASSPQPNGTFTIDGVPLTSSHVGKDIVVQSLCRTAKDHGKLRVVYETNGTSLPWASGYNALVGDIPTNTSGSDFDLHNLDPAIWNGIYKVHGLNSLSGSYPYGSTMAVDPLTDTVDRTTVVLKRQNDDLASDRIHTIASGSVYGDTILVSETPKHFLGLQVDGQAAQYYGERSLFGMPRLFRPFVGVQVAPAENRAVCSLVEVEYCARTADGQEQILMPPPSLLLGGAHKTQSTYNIKIYNTLKEASEGVRHRATGEVLASHRDVLVHALSPFARDAPEVLQLGTERQDPSAEPAAVAEIRVLASGMPPTPASYPALRVESGYVYAVQRVFGSADGPYATVRRPKVGDRAHIHGGARTAYSNVLLSSQTGTTGAYKVPGTTTTTLRKITDIQTPTPGLYPWSLRIGLYKAVT